MRCVLSERFLLPVNSVQAINSYELFNRQRVVSGHFQSYAGNTSGYNDVTKQSSLASVQLVKKGVNRVFLLQKVTLYLKMICCSLVTEHSLGNGCSPLFIMLNLI